MNKLGFKKWFSIILAGFVGQIAWALENMYFSTFAYYASNKIHFVTLMTALSAITATITTLLMGALSDRLGKRKPFIAYGYIIWGISIILFAFLDPHSNFNIVANSMFVAGVLIVIMDCVMTFFGSTANDACFNAMVTDQTDTSIRGKVESILSVLPMIAMIVIVLVSGIFKADISGGRWDLFFYVIGGLTSLIGIALIFLLDKDVAKPNKEEPYIKNIFYGFRPKVIKNNKNLYVLFICFCVFSIGIQVYFPYLIIYVQDALQLQDMDYIITLGSVLIVSSIITIILGLFMDKIGKSKLLIPVILVAAVGCLLFFFANNMVFAIIAGIIMISGYMLSVAIMGAKIRDLTPVNEVGLFQGIRMVFVVMIPMVTGPYIGEGLSHINEVTRTNEYGQVVTSPNHFIFLGGAIIILLSLIPAIMFLIQEKKDAR